MSKTSDSVPTPVKRAKRAYTRKPPLKNGDRSAKPAPKSRKKKAADSCQREIRDFLTEKEKSDNVVEATKTTNLPVEKSSPSHPIQSGAGSGVAHEPERKDYDGDSLGAVVDTKIGEQQENLFQVAFPPINSLKKDWSASQAASAAHKKEIGELKGEVEDLRKAKKARNLLIVNLIREAQMIKQDHNLQVTNLQSELTEACEAASQGVTKTQELSATLKERDATASSYLKLIKYWRDEFAITSRKLAGSVQELEDAKSTQKSMVESWALGRDQLKAELDRTKRAKSAPEIRLAKERGGLEAEIERIKKAPLELVTLKRKYDQLDTEFKSLKESKAAELDAVYQRLDGTRKSFIRLNTRYGQLFKVANDVSNYAGSMANDYYGEVGRAIKKLKSELQSSSMAKI